MDKLQKGLKAPELNANDVHGNQVLNSGSNLTLIQFFRFATCPFCNLRVMETQEWVKSKKGIQVIGVFGSPEKEVRDLANKFNLSFQIIADPQGHLYRKFKIQKSLFGVLKGMVFRFPTLMRAIFVERFFPKSTHGHMLTMPAEFLLDAAGNLLYVHYGNDEGDHVPFQIYDAWLGK